MNLPFPWDSGKMTIINNLAFNHDFSCIAISTDTYHKIFNCDPFGEFYSSSRNASGSHGEGEVGNDGSSGAGAGSGASPGHGQGQGQGQGQSQKDEYPTLYLKMLFSTSLTIIVPQNESHINRLLKIYNLKHNMKICELTFPSNIIDVKLNRKRLCIVLESGQIYLYDLSCVRLIKVLEVNPFSTQDSHEDSHGLEFVGDLSADDGSFLVLPVQLINEHTDLFNTENGTPSSLKPSDSSILQSLGPLVALASEKYDTSNISLQDLQKESQGWVLVYDTIHLRPRLIYKAHNSNIAKVKISNDASTIATASFKGTIVRVCHLRLKESVDIKEPLVISHITSLRRGHNPARINCLSFSLDNTILGCGSESHTVHFFNLKKTSGHSQDYHQNSSDEIDPDDNNRSSEDLNENLANLLVSKTPDQPSHNQKEPLSYFSYLPTIKKMVERNPYTKTIVSNLPYKNYFDNLILEPPRRSFAYIRVPDLSSSSRQLLRHGAKNKVEIGFTNKSKDGHMVLLASYNSGNFYHYVIPKVSSSSEGVEDRQKCSLLATYSLF